MSKEIVKEMTAISPPVSWIRDRLMEVGGSIGSVWFYKRTDGTLRKMCFKLRVSNPKYVKAPKSEHSTIITIMPNGSSRVTFSKTKNVDEANNQLRVFDCNLHILDAEGKVTGKRGGYRMINLEGVVRMKIKGTIINIM